MCSVFIFFFFFFFKQKTAYEIMPSLVGSEMCIRDRPCTSSSTASRTRSPSTAESSACPLRLSRIACSSGARPPSAGGVHSAGWMSVRRASTWAESSPSSSHRSASHSHQASMSRPAKIRRHWRPLVSSARRSSPPRSHCTTWLAVLRPRPTPKRFSASMNTGRVPPAAPRQLWRGAAGGTLPVFIDAEKRLGVGRGRKTASQVVQWLRGGDERLALLTNGRQWRLIFAGLDIDAWCEWDADLWLEEGELSAQVDALRTLIQPALWTPPADGGRAPLEQAILDSRKGQAELSAVLGERVREAVELLVQGHGEALREQAADVDPADIYRTAVRVVMRMVVVLFAESRELLPRDNALYQGSYGLGGLIEELEKAAARGGARLARSYAAWPRVLALFALVYEGSSHPALPVPAYGGELFAPGDPEAADGLTRALAVFERASFARELLPDRDVHRMLELITRTRVMSS